MKLIDSFLRVASLGKTKNFMTNFVTTIGSTVYVTEDWDILSSSTKAITLRHERVHMRQSKRLGRFLFSFLYLFAPVPILFAYYRTKFEKEAYEESLKAYFEYYGSKFFTPALKENVIHHFSSSEYLWMWINNRSIEEWYDNVVKEITKEQA